ncbi:MAG: hypothetical protein JWN44_6185 [Myxococcales bacterium]|nr:hypothetical protein [Myxococcales bacterium]
MKHALRLASVFLAATAALVGFVQPVRAADLPCGPADKGTVSLDGLTDDWGEVEGLDTGGKDPNLSFTLKCNVEERTLMFLVDVRDNYFVRSRQAHPGEDHFTLTLGGHVLTVFPGDARAIPTLVREGKKPAKGIKAVSALQEHGWAVELAVPFSAVPGWKAGMPLSYRVGVADCDSKAAFTTDKTLDAGGSLVFAEGDSALEGFLKDRGLKRGDIWFDKGVSLGGKSGGRVVLAGRNLAFITDGFVFVELPFKARADAKEARLADLAGDGRHALIVRYVERGNGGSREVLAAYRIAGESEIRRVFAAEVAKQAPQGRIDDKVSYLKRGRATDILIEAGSAPGLSAETWKEAPADDMIPLMLPWADDRHARYQFSGDEYKRAH